MYKFIIITIIIYYFINYYYLQWIENIDLNNNKKNKKDTNLLFIGTKGSGKTSLIQCFLQNSKSVLLIIYILYLDINLFWLLLLLLLLNLYKYIIK